MIDAVRGLFGEDPAIGSHHRSPASSSDRPSVTFAELARAGISRAPDFDQQWQLFEGTNGDIVQSYFGSAAGTAVVLTQSGGLWFDCNRAIGRNADIEELVHRANMIHVQANRVLMGKDRLASTELFYTVLAYLFALLERQASQAGDPSESVVEGKKSLAVAERMLSRIQEYQVGIGQRLTQRRYLLGMLVAALIAILVPAFILSMVSNWDGDSAWESLIGMTPNNPTPMLLCVVSGAVGATVSVMARMTSGSLILAPFAPRWLAFILGAVRVVLGAVFGLVIYVLVQSNIIPIELPPLVLYENRNTLLTAAEYENLYNSELFYFIVCLSFVAGFSERFAQDAISMTQQGWTSAMRSRLLSASDVKDFGDARGQPQSP